MKILLTGASGLLGYAFAQAASRRGHHIVGLVHQFEGQIPGLAEQQALDLSKSEAVERFVLDLFPDAIVNCAAVSLPHQCDAQPARSQALNVTLPQQLAQLARHLFARFLHVSSDQVFDGAKAPYAIADPVNPLNRYAQQKAEAEKAVLEDAPEQAAILRLPLLNGNSPRGSRSLHEGLFAQWSAGRPASLFTDEIRQPCLADNAAQAMVELCERKDVHGLLHWAGQTALSRFEMGKLVLQRFGLPEHLIAPTKRTDNPQTASRPENLSLDLQPLAGLLKTQPQPFSAQLDSLVVPKAFRSWYNAI